ncbi:hypothetical protein IAI58_22650 (plasmid) [Roseomonas marmotae]|uniref:helix-turn-helix domain-containing protein n=1 Tax=Roseomonas marmotae TaxID=2768161 RepID=UPI001AD6DEF1|nr:helix-turn-helix domain-containing protein [Roseomonas marmotae]QTI82155.1 hypothetical protein IAI58_22650 [Roseomonas marmotae]
MSIDCMNWVKNLCPKFIKSSPRQLLKELADFADEQDECYPSVALLHEVTSQSIRTIHTNLRILQEMELIKISKRPNRSSRYKINRHLPFPNRQSRKRGAKSAYTRNPRPLDSKTSAYDQHGLEGRPCNTRVDAKSAPTPANAAWGAESVSPGVQNLSSRGAKSAHKPPKNHQRTTRGRGARVRATPAPLPPSWQPSAGDAAYARRLGLDPAAVADRFRKHQRASGRACADWSARWELWCDEDAQKAGLASAGAAPAGDAAPAPAEDEQVRRVRCWVERWQAKAAAGQSTQATESVMASVCPEALALVRQRKPEVFRVASAAAGFSFTGM